MPEKFTVHAGCTNPNCERCKELHREQDATAAALFKIAEVMRDLDFVALEIELDGYNVKAHITRQRPESATCSTKT